MTTPLCKSLCQSKFSLVFCFLFSLSSLSWAVTAPIEVQDVKFDDVKVGKYKWIQAEIKLLAPTASKFEFENQRNPNYVDNIKMTFSICFENKKNKNYEFYQSQVEIVSMEKGQDEYAYFFLPGVITERDSLNEEPFAWMLEFEISGKQLPNDPETFKENFSDKLKSKTAVESFLSQLEDGLERNQGMLLAEYLAPGVVKGRAKNLDESVTYVRLEPENN